MKGWHLRNSEKSIIGDQKSIISARLFSFSKFRCLAIDTAIREFMSAEPVCMRTAKGKLFSGRCRHFSGLFLEVSLYQNP